MPIHCPLPIGRFSDTDFDAIDEVVMACAYATHNKLGRLCDEHVYENDLVDRLRTAGFSDVHTQVAVTVSFRDFTKVYRLDLVVKGMMYELKAVNDFSPAHDAQVYHYAALLDIDRIKLLNFGSLRVKGRLRRCPFGSLDRKVIDVDRVRWQPMSGHCEKLASEAESCFCDWGGFLDAHLFEDALIAFNGGEHGCIQRLPVVREDGLKLGNHRTALHAEDIGFVVTAMGEDTSAHERHLQTLLKVLPIRGWQWINIHHRQMRMVTVMK